MTLLNRQTFIFPDSRAESKNLTIFILNVIFSMIFIKKGFVKALY